MIYFHFTASDNLVGKLIREFTGKNILHPAEWSHVELIVPGRGYLGAQLDGIKLRPFDYEDGPNGKKVKEGFAVIDCSEEVERKAWKWAWEQYGKPYDLMACIGCGLHRDWHKLGSWFCSEYVAADLEQAGDPLVDPDKFPDRVTPQDLWDSPRVIRLDGDQLNTLLLFESGEKAWRQRRYDAALR